METAGNRIITQRGVRSRVLPNRLPPGNRSRRTDSHQALNDFPLIGREDLNRQVVDETDAATGLLLNRKQVTSHWFDLDGVQLAR
jgi:hypothetical protein